MANTAVVYRLKNMHDTLRVNGLFGGVLTLGKDSTNNVWAQIRDVPVPGNPTKDKLIPGPNPVICKYKYWKKLYPQTRVLAPVKEFDLFYTAYDRKPKGYEPDPFMFQTLGKLDERLRPGQEVLGIAYKNESKAFMLTWLKVKGTSTQTIGGKKIKLIWDKPLDAPRVEGLDDGLWLRAYWYAWSTFYPKTTLTGKE